MGGIIVVWLIGLMVFFFILHSVIRSAIDSSKLAANIREIRDFLQGQSAASSAPPGSEKPGETCPGCGSKVRQEDKYCPECGLKLRG